MTERDVKRVLLVIAALASCEPRSAAPIVSLELPLPKTDVARTTATLLQATRSNEHDYSSERGLVHIIEQLDGTFAGTYTDGVFTCGRASNNLNGFACDWFEGLVEGRAVFIPKADGGFEGTWGTGSSVDDGGLWVLVPIAPRGNGIDGLWDTNWGVATVKEAGDGVHVAYRDGTMDCELHGRERLVCQWIEGSMRGAADLTLESPRVMRGRWGNGASSTDGGAWVFIRR